MSGLGVQPWWGMQGANKYKNIQKNTKLIISQKLRIAQKKSVVQKMSAISIPIDYANLVTYEESFLGCRLGTCGAQTRYDVIWNFVPHFFYLIAHLFCQDGHFWGGGGLYILNYDRANFPTFSVGKARTFFLEMLKKKKCWKLIIFNLIISGKKFKKFNKSVRF